jgi:DNA-binding NtrC family response regulator
MTAYLQSPWAAVVDDDPEQRHLLRQSLEEAGYQVVEGGDGEAALVLAQKNPLDVMLLDVRMPQMDGLTALKTLRRNFRLLPVVLLTAFIDVRDAVEAMKVGARDYLEKPVDLDELIILLDEIVGTGRLETHSGNVAQVPIPKGVIAESPALRSVFHEAARAAVSDVTVLIQGESGSGKEVLARYLHSHSLRAKGPLVAINCAALPESLIESALFGHEKGSFTGASSRRIGHFEEAHKGTLFLDEIGDMPLPLQTRLLRVLEDHRVRRIGGKEEIQVDVRVIAATNRRLEEEVQAGRFREDLYYRFNIVSLRLPPLRERREDILPLADSFLCDNNFKEKRFSPAASKMLAEYLWPGNVRELRNAVMRSAILCRGNLILPEDLPEPIRNPFEINGYDETLCRRGQTLDEIEKMAILKAVEEASGNKTLAAQTLGISRRNLIYKLRSYGF